MALSQATHLGLCQAYAWKIAHRVAKRFVNGVFIFAERLQLHLPRGGNTFFSHLAPKTFAVSPKFAFHHFIFADGKQPHMCERLQMHPCLSEKNNCAKWPIQTAKFSENVLLLFSIRRFRQSVQNFSVSNANIIEIKCTKIHKNAQTVFGVG